MQACPDFGHSVSLRQVLRDAERFGADDIRITACNCCSKSVQPGDLFVAIAGVLDDGHDHVAEAVARGCAAVLAQRPVSAGVPVDYVPDSREAYGRICQALAGNPSRRLRVVGITGTNGKTTTSYLIASVLGHAGYEPGILGTIGCFDGNEFKESSMTTPAPDQLARCLGRMVRNGCTHAVMEVSSHALDQSRVAGISFDVACVTNVRRDHLDYHRSIHDYRMAKSRLLDHLAPEGFAVLNADDPTSVGYLSRIDGPVLTIGVRAAAEIMGTLVEQYVSEQTFLLTAGSDTIPVRTRMIGLHHVYNCLTAAAVGLTYGIDLATVVRGLEAVEHLPGRLERIECGQPFGVFVDFAHTPDALAGSLQTLREVVSGRLICVFGAGGDRDRHKRPLMGKAVEAGADLAIVTGDNPRSEDPEAIIADILAGCRFPDAVEVVPDRARAIQRALEEAQPGDCVLIAGKGHEKYQIIGSHRHPFDDVEVARQWLYRLGALQVGLRA
ncbi:MAG: UDP-N-acetylmuramoyl-L-alanyl-D-glutamate--2,6-diaminopimelate ligase [Pirellulales bacterium]|nr:UDP-N-acetylmuramoyl-L-alanyl-D-glutamate--2,6-diaminopimelate ligase [Pirellulales bacterium]